ncbi:condensation domain-containing protein [Thermopolyspora sp. NPDC052614]|uniref:condensation domain-containing protein n=1 Tax=Thermopolyspora sp. NPDC052614 TaxID=3155682 RepID=UPI003417A009
MTADRVASSAQRRLWILDRLYPGCAAYVIPVVYRIEGDLDAEALGHALSDVVRRHEVLRTGYRMVRGALRQTVRPAGPVPIPVVDVAAHRSPGEEAERLAAAEALRPFDLSAGEVIRALLVRTAPGRHLLCLSLHHIACDGWSLRVLEDELAACYRSRLAGSPGDLPPLPEQYGDFAEWQQARLADPALRPVRDHWREHLAGIPAPATIRTDRPRPAVWSFAGGHVRFRIGPEVAERVRLLARAAATTPYTVLLAAFALLVREHGAPGPDVVIGTPVAGRSRESHYRLIGLFQNTVVQRIRVPDRTTFRDLVRLTREESRNAIVNQALPFDALVEELNPARDPGLNPVFQLMFSHEEDEPGGPALPGCAVRRTFGDTRTAKVDLTLGVARDGPGYTGRLEYSTDLFTAATARRIAERFGVLLENATSAPFRVMGSVE